jgi:hypothetical protein
MQKTCCPAAYFGALTKCFPQCTNASQTTSKRKMGRLPLFQLPRIAAPLVRPAGGDHARLRQNSSNMPTMATPTPLRGTRILLWGATTYHFFRELKLLCLIDFTKSLPAWWISILFVGMCFIDTHVSHAIIRTQDQLSDLFRRSLESNFFAHTHPLKFFLDSINCLLRIGSS